MSRDEFIEMMLTAKMQCDLAVALYHGDEAIAELASRVGARFRTFNCANTAAAALIFHDHAHLVFCGTNDISDWAQNINTKLTTIDNFEVHSGFASQAEWMSREINRSDFYSLVEGKRLYIGGHSAGGAIAELMPIVSSRMLSSVDGVYTFGAPKSMARRSAAKYMAMPFKAYGFSMDGDPIPYVPLNLVRMLLGKRTYAHGSVGLSINDDGLVRSASGTTAVEKTFAVAKSIYLAGLTSLAVFIRQLPSLMKSHSILRYQDAIEQRLQESTKENTV